MARPTNKLTATAVAKVRKPGRHSDGGGLYLNVSNAGTKSWVFIWSRDKRKREMGLGPYPPVSLAGARERADACRKQVANGLDPIVERDRDTRKTFGESADACFEAMKGTWRHRKTHLIWKRSMEHYCAPIRSRPVADVNTEDVLQVLNPIWQSKSETASKLRGRIERVLDFARTKGWRTGDNPARWRGHLQNALPKPRKLTRGHHPAMPFKDVPAFFEQLQTRQSTAARALEFTILTAARTGEALGARWSEVDFDESAWTVPPERMKGGIGHTVPLSNQAVEVLRSLLDTRISDFIFLGMKQKRPLSPMAMEMLLRRMKIGEATVHGFRSSFRDWCGDETTFPREVAEAALAHKVGSNVERAYRRRDALAKRRQLMQAWADYCSGASSENVVPLRVTADG